MEDYKSEIIESRKGCLGGSDAAMLKQIADTGVIPQSALKRLAVLKGLIEQPQVTTVAMRFGDFIEQSIFEGLGYGKVGYESNPLFESRKFSKDNVKLICHPDFVYVDKIHKAVYVYECKATKASISETKEAYRAQMYVEWMLAKEKHPGYTVVVSLVHYDASNVDLTKDFEFDPENVTISKVYAKNAMVFDIDKAMSIVNEFLEHFDAYYEDEEIPSEYLPASVREEFEMMTRFLTEIKEREAKVEEFKAKLYKFMTDKNIKSIKNEQWSITRVDPTKSASFDSKAFLSDYQKKHPQLYKKLVVDFTKTTEKKGYVSIKVKKSEDK